MYISFRGIKVSAERAKWCFRIAMLGLALLLVALVADRIVRAPIVAVVAFGASQLSLLLAFLIAVPALMIALVFMLAPIGLVLVGITHEHQVWKTWWFWVITAVCEILGVCILAWFDANYRKRDTYA